MSFKYLSHTADLKAALEAPNIDRLYAEAVALVRDVLVGDSPIEASLAREIRLGTDDPAERLFRFVRELVFLYDEEGFLAARVETGDPLRVVGERFDSARHRSERQIKALTRHEFTLDHGPDGYHAVLLFDL